MDEAHPFGRAAACLLLGLTVLPGWGCGSGQDALPTLPLPTAGIGTPAVYATVAGDGGAGIAVHLRFPPAGRYPLDPVTSLAPIVVEVPPFLTENAGFHQSMDPAPEGLVHLSFLWPGMTDPGTGRTSAGTNDYGGPVALSVLRHVLRFATGLTGTTDGWPVTALGGPSGIMPLPTNVGLYAFSHPGIPATTVFAAHGDEFPSVSYLVGRENPTQDLTTSVELGHWDLATHVPVPNPFYAYAADYDPDAIDLSAAYLHAGWDATADRPFLDDGVSTYLLGTRIPRMFGLRCYSRALTHALDANGVLTPATWPADLAKPADVDAWWPTRQTVGHYGDVGVRAPQLRVLLVFARDDHVQVAPDKPHVHQAWDGFVHAAGLPWVRLNPDRSYVEALHGGPAAWAPDHDALWEPPDWTDARPLGYDGSVPLATKQVARAAVAEMADRTQYGDWSANLPGVLP